jgi:hypothetical protein
MRLAYDSSYLYIFYKIYDKYIITNNGSNVWNDDSLELFLDMNHDRASSPQNDDFQFIFSPNPTYAAIASPVPGFSGQGNGSGGYNTSWSSGSTIKFITSGQGTGGVATICTSLCTSTDNNAANQDTDDFWQFEAKIPLANVGKSSGMQTGDIIGLAFYVNEDDTGDSNQRVYKIDTNVIFNKPNTWGVAQF